MNRKCEQCGEEKQCMGGRSAHQSNWYCARCDYPQDEIDRLRAELQQHQWRSIESAPRDGRNVVIGKWSYGQWMWAKARFIGGSWFKVGGNETFGQPTHYFEIPEPPEPDQ